MVHPPDSMAFQPLSSPGNCQRESYRFASALHVSPERVSSFKSLYVRLYFERLSLIPPLDYLSRPRLCRDPAYLGSSRQSLGS